MKPIYYEKICTTYAQLEAIFATHAQICLFSSGGKDSLTLMHLLRPWQHSVTILHNDMDNGWPGVTQNLCALAQDWGFSQPIITHPSLTIDAYIAEFGYQTEMVPIEADTVIMPAAPYGDGSLRVSSFWHCELVRCIMPLFQLALTLSPSAIVTGSRATDGPAFAAMGHRTTDAKEMWGFERYNPLLEWNSAEIYAYIDALGIPLPEHYQWKRLNGDKYQFPDCMRCTFAPEHWQLLKEHYPEVYQQYWPATKTVYEALALKQWNYTKRLMRVIIDNA